MYLKISCRNIIKIWAGFYHNISTDKKPQRDKCSIDCCKYLKGKAVNTLNKYKHRSAFAGDAQKLLKPIYEDLTKTELLERCLGGHTQNNESFNNCVWNMAPKHLFNGKKVFEIAFKTSAYIFNEGFHPVFKIIEVLGIKLDQTTFLYAGKLDTERITIANRRSLDALKEARTLCRQAGLEQNENFEQSKGT